MPGNGRKIGLGLAPTRRPRASGSWTPPPVSAPVVVVAPSINGDPTQGQTLLCDKGAWSGSPSYAYQWTRDGANISAATSSSYTTQAADVAHVITCRVTATNTGGSTSSTPTGVTCVSSGSGTDYAPTFIYDSGGFLGTQATSFGVVTTALAPAGSTLVLTHVGGSGAQLTGVTSAGGTWTLGTSSTQGLAATVASIKLSADLPAGSTITITQNASTGPSVMVFGWQGGIALDQTAPAAFTAATSWSTTIADGNLPCYCAALITTNTDVGGIGTTAGWTTADSHGSTFGTKLIYRRIETGQSPVTITSGSSASGQSMIFVTFTAPAPGGGGGGTTVTSVSQLQSVFASANPGDIILLGAGLTFSGATLASKTISGARVTIKSADTNNKATLVNTTLTSVSGVTVTDVKLGLTGGAAAFGMTSCANITLSSFSLPSGAGRTGVGVVASSSTNITVQDGVFTDVFRGVQFHDSGGVIQRNKFTLLGEDAIHFSACTSLTIRRNFGSNWNTSPGEHADFVQHTLGGAGSSSSNITIQENLDTLGSGTSHQSFFLADMAISTADVSRNLSVGPANHGFMLSAISGGTCDSNQTIPLTVTGLGAWVTIDNDTTLTLSNSKYGAIIRSGTNSGITETSNTVVSDPGDSGAAAIAAFRALYTDIPT